MKALIIFPAILLAAGCTRPLQDLAPSPRSEPSAHYAGGSGPSAKGVVCGRVVWPEVVPEIRPISGLIGGTHDGVPARWGEMPNHLAPEIDPETDGLANAVVHLKSCDAARSKPWPFAPLRIEQRDRTISARQGPARGRTGFVRVGEPFEMVSLDGDYHMLRARGAGFFTLPFPEPDKPLRRSIDRAGRTEFTSAAGYFWSSADVFACEHPYYTTTDAAGRFTLDGVPSGDYTLVAWHRNWKLLHFERDPESGKIMRLLFDEPFRVERAVAVADGRVEIQLRLP